jgi:glycosyltransferase involved in cell wall biosynthesis
MYHNHQINIIAPNIKNGGGRELLEYLLIHLDEVYKNIDVVVYIDSSLTNILQTNNRVVIKTSNSLQKIKIYSKRIDNAIYFGNLPPFVKSSNSLVYFHNMYLVMDLKNLIRQSTYFLLKFGLQQLYIRYFIKNVDTVAVQNVKTKIMFIKKYKYNNIELLPFYRICPKNKKSLKKIYDFCYISLAHPHKNHKLLFDALNILGNKGFQLRVVVTIEESSFDLIKQLNYINKLYDIQIINIGSVSKEVVCDIYGKTKCLIFPSTQESFGLALIEAAELGLDVIAADLPYTHEIISTPFLFDPLCVLSCVEVIERYLDTQSSVQCEKHVVNKVDDLIMKFMGHVNV